MLMSFQLSAAAGALVGNEQCLNGPVERVLRLEQAFRVQLAHCSTTDVDTWYSQ